jgi:uncharacterized protein (TIGR02996 family)
VGDVTRTEQALLAAVIADPHNDLHRLAYADLCEEYGDYVRAEFVRVQIELARVGEVALPDGTTGVRTGCPEDDRRERALRRRERDLLTADRPGRWSPYPLAAFADVVFRRGFVAEVTLPCDAWVAHGPTLVRAAPLEKVTLAGKEPYSPAWEALPPGAHPCWWWVCASRHNANRPEALPRPLFRALARLRREERRTGTGLGFADRDLAILDLSEAILRWARAAAVAAPGGRP